MGNSPLAVCRIVSPLKVSPRTHEIDTITIHCVVGQCTAESLGAFFASPAAPGSSNYGVDKFGRVGVYVDECDRSFASSNVANDDRAITIEVASDTAHPYAVTEDAYNGLIDLLADICQRNPGIGRLRWLGDETLVGQVDRQNMTVHRWFAPKECPGEYLFDRMGQIAQEVNDILEGDEMQNTEKNYSVFQEFMRRYETEQRNMEASEYAKAACQKAVSCGLFTDGTKDGSIDSPQAYLRRQELAVILDRKGELG